MTRYIIEQTVELHFDVHCDSSAEALARADRVVDELGECLDSGGEPLAILGSLEGLEVEPGDGPFLSDHPITPKRRRARA